MKFKIFKFKTVESTNDVAINLIRNNKKTSGCVCAEKQTKGKGTRGKIWISCKGNLFSTFFFPLNKKYPPFHEFSFINPIIISNVIKKYCKNESITFKFPNDIFVNGKKICGILQEVINLKKRDFLIIGIGLNIISSPDLGNDYEATNIYYETRYNYNMRQDVS